MCAAFGCEYKVDSELTSDRDNVKKRTVNIIE